MRNEAALDAWLNEQKPNRSEVSAGVSAPLKSTHGESRAFEIQVPVLECAIQLRKSIYRGDLKPQDLPVDQKSERGRIRQARQTGRRSAGEFTIRDYMAHIEEDNIPAEAQEDIIFDYWNKLAFVCWEAAKLEQEQHGDPSAWLRLARTYIDTVMKDRPNWTPGQLNLARISMMEGKDGEALVTLKQILGSKITEDKSPAPPPPDDSSAIADMIIKMAPERNPRVTAKLIRRSFGPVSQATIRKATEALIGKVDGKLLDDVFHSVADR